MMILYVRSFSRSEVRSQHHVALQREAVHVMHKTHAYQYGMHVASQLLADLSVRKGLLM